jgi:hypothetical protein
MRRDSSTPSRRPPGWALALLVAVVFGLHQDVWNWSRVEPLMFGFLPVGLAYHTAYSILAAVTMAVLVRFAWPRDLESPGAGAEIRRPPQS